MQTSDRHHNRDWESYGCVVMLALATMHGHQRRNMSRIRTIMSEAVAQRVCHAQQHGRRTLPGPVSAPSPYILQRVLYSNSVKRKGNLSGRSRGGKVVGSSDMPRQGHEQRHGEFARTSKSTHPLFQDLQQQQQQRQHRTTLPAKPAQRVDTQTRPRKNIVGASPAATTATTASASPLHSVDATKASLSQESPPITEEKTPYTRPLNDPTRKSRKPSAHTASHDYVSTQPLQEDVLERDPPSPPGFMGLYGSTASFDACRAPAQLRRAIHHFLASHPHPNSHHMTEMLQACYHLGQIASSTSDSHRGGIGGTRTRKGAIEESVWPPKDEAGWDGHGNDSLDMLSNVLLDSIYHSLGFSSEEVFELATWIYQRGWEQERQITPMYMSKTTTVDRQGPMDHTMRPAPSVAVLNSYLRVCSVTHHTDRAVEMFDDRERLLKNIRPEASLYAHWLWVLACQASSPPLAPSSPLSTTLSASSVDAKAQEVINVASRVLARQARYPFWIKMLLGVMIGGTVGKFTTLGLMALPVHGGGEGAGATGGRGGLDVGVSQEGGVEEAMEAASHIGSSLSADGVLHALTSPEVATAAGLATFALSFGLFLIRDTTTNAAISSAAILHQGRGGGRVDEMAKEATHGGLQDSGPRRRSVGEDMNVNGKENEKAGEKGEGEEEEEETAVWTVRDDDDDDPERILERLQQVQRLPRARFIGPYFFQDLVSADEGILRRYLEEQYQHLKKGYARSK
ncbi:hypothetical protein BGZ73_006224 [Actinomortierella ambigua]|nr:hypothetical protein BGZ73_006224 [Actinomortierella ambigua]